MTTTLNTLTLDQLLAMKSKYDAEILARGAGSVAKKEKKAKRVGVSGPWSDYTKKVLAEHAEAVTAFKEAAESKLGAHLKWLSQYKASHEAEWLAYQAAWKLEHPKGAAVAEAAEPAEAEDDTASVASSAASTAAPAAAAKRRGPKKLTEMTIEERAAHDSKVAERKAKKTAATPAEAEARAAAPVAVAEPVAVPEPVAAPVAVPEPVAVAAPVPAAASLPASPAAEVEEAATELFAFKLDGTAYVRPGVKDADGEVQWVTGDLWYSKKAAKDCKGDYAGELMEDGSINTDAEEPSFE